MQTLEQQRDEVATRLSKAIMAQEIVLAAAMRRGPPYGLTAADKAKLTQEDKIILESYEQIKRINAQLACQFNYAYKAQTEQARAAFPLH